MTAAGEDHLIPREARQPTRPIGVTSPKMLVGGRLVPSLSERTFESVDPFTGRTWAAVPDAGEQDVDAAVDAARKAFEDGPWQRSTGTERARLIRRLANLIAEHAERLSITETTDNGKVIRETRTQLEVLADWYLYFAGAADKIHGETIPSSKSSFFVYTRREPVGVVAAILPWNSPLLQLGFKLAPALAAGCTVVAKPAEQASVAVLEFAELVQEAGFPDGVVNVVTGAGGTGRALVQHPGVDKVAFTGSTETGIAVMRDAAGHLARVTLELGGKSPNIVFEDADLDAAASGAVAGVFAAAGQTCIAGSRLLVHESVQGELAALVAERARRIVLGDPLLEETEMGPVAFREHLDRVVSYIRLGEEEGAVRACGGERPRDPRLKDGYFVEPTVLTEVRNSMRVAQEEIFGPVVAVIPFADEDEAIRIANDTRYGLAAGIWTNDLRRAHRVAHRVRAGTVWINAYRTISYDTPFGGYRMSGLGRENGSEGLAEYLETKAVWVELAGSTRDPFTLG